MAGRSAISLEARFWEKVDKRGPDECWPWRASRYRTGYGRFGVGPASSRVQTSAHRVAFDLANGPIPEGLVVDHICAVRECVNPRHLQVLTNAANILRGTGPTAVNARKTSCMRGHAFDDTNTGRNTFGNRFCRTCEALRVAGELA